MLNNKFLHTSRLEKLGSPIWERLFMISMRYSDSLSLDQIKTYGMFTTGNKQLDVQVNSDLIDKYVTINDMVEYFKEGVNFYVRRHTDTKEIYELIAAYLICWKEYLENGINIGGAPIDDLIAMDRFASSVYDHAIEHINEDFINSNLLKFIGNVKLGRAAFEKEPEPVVINGEVEVKKRDSFAALFSERVFSGRGN